MPHAPHYQQAIKPKLASRFISLVVLAGTSLAAQQNVDHISTNAQHSSNQQPTGIACQVQMDSNPPTVFSHYYTLRHVYSTTFSLPTTYATRSVGSRRLDGTSCETFALAEIPPTLLCKASARLDINSHSCPLPPRASSRPRF